MLSLYDFLRAGHVKRWHIINTAASQSIAEHSYLVAIIAMHLCKDMGGELVEQQECAVWALFHDAVEIRTGDIPTPAKKLIRQVDYYKDMDISADQSGPDVFERLDTLLMPEAPFIANGEPAEDVVRCVKMADVIEAAHWIRENGLGRHAQIVADKNWRAVEDLVAKYSTETEIDWYGPVNKVLMALGIPYVSQEERVSPP
jgi:5'-deoxynucleotidase